MKKFIIFSPHYDSNNGGAIALHKLCDIINRNGGEAYMHPMFNSHETSMLNNLDVFEVIEKEKKILLENFVAIVNTDYRTPVRHIFQDKNYDADWIVVYPEIVFGNPLGAKNIVRWFLHNPWFHTGKFFYSRGEFHIRHSSLFKEYLFPECCLSKNTLNVVDFNLSRFNTDGASLNRTGTAYCMRKGRGRQIEHDLSNSILIDGMSIADVIQVFKTVKTFYSYDTETAFSQYAALCGCDSVVIPDPNISEIQWRPDMRYAYGVAYGQRNIEIARSTASLLRPFMLELEQNSVREVLSFVNEASDHFDN
jgi:hypothetical protein